MNHETQPPPIGSGTYRRLLRNGGFEAFLGTQFLGAFNDNVYKMMVSMIAVGVASNAQLGARYLAIAGAVFVLPYLLFAGHAGQLADRFSKTRVLQITKALEILTMLLGLGALLMNRIEMLLAVLFLLAMQANFFSPAKYGILPEMMGEAELTAANGLVEFSTLAAIVLGTSFGSFLIETWKDDPWRMGSTLLAIAVAGTLCSFKIPKVAPSGSSEPFHWNPFYEVWLGCRTLLRNRALALTVTGLSYFWFIGALFQMSILLLGKEALHASEMQLGLLATALAIGIGLGSIAAGWLSRDHIELGLVPAGALLLGVFSVILGASHSYAAVMCWLVVIGICGGLFFVPLNAFLQERAGAQEKGRLLATNNFVNMLGILLASAVLWLLHDQLHWSAAAIIAALGMVTMAATIYIVSVLPGEIVRLVLFGLSRMAFRIRIIGAERLPVSGGGFAGCKSRVVRRRTLDWLQYASLHPFPGMEALLRLEICSAVLHRAAGHPNSFRLAERDAEIAPEGRRRAEARRVGVHFSRGRTNSHRTRTGVSAGSRAADAVFAQHTHHSDLHRWTVETSAQREWSAVSEKLAARVAPRSTNRYWQSRKLANHGRRAAAPRTGVGHGSRESA